MEVNCPVYDTTEEHCLGKKERDICSCGGDRTKCDFYPEAKQSTIKEKEQININKTNTKTSKDERNEKLFASWQSIAPCQDCRVANICRYKDSIKRPDYNPDVFELTVKCKLKNEYSKGD